MKRFVIVYDLNGVEEIYGYADSLEELNIKVSNCIEDGILDLNVHIAE